MSSRTPIPTRFFALTVVRRGSRFLVVQEAKGAKDWYLPAGRAEVGETLQAAAVRETHEEAGIPVLLEGVLRIEHSPAPDGSARVRAIFLARPADDRPLKSHADEHSLRAAWVDLATLESLQLRSDEVRDLFEYVEQGGKVYPLGVLTFEGQGWS